MRRVAHVGPLMAPGGMSSVITILAANPPKGGEPLPVIRIRGEGSCKNYDDGESQGMK